jgi:glycosyltransferase involved in cell wall biosynthesis
MSEDIGSPMIADNRLLKVLHLSADFPDPFDAAKTTVIRTLLELSAEQFDHMVMSINRTEPGVMGVSKALLTGGLHAETTLFQWGVAMQYHALGRGLFHRTFLERLSDRMADQVIANGWHPDLVVGHKLTVEGIAAMRLATRLDLPFAITVQGDTDTKILAARPDLAPIFRRIYHNARLVTFFAPWTHDAIEAKLGKRKGPTAIIPCPTELDQPLAPVPGGNGLASVFHLKNHARKNLPVMAEAMRLLASTGAAQKLAIFGGGTHVDMAAAKASAGKAPGLVFEGSLERSQVARRLNGATGFVLPSRRETFGLVFIEALFAGLPIIYPAGQAVSGYFSDCPFAIAVPPNDPKALAAAMARLANEESSLKATLRGWQLSLAAQRFMKPAIGRDYAASLMSATGVSAAGTIPTDTMP